ncbi:MULTISPECIES: hypothetical protein [Micrococcaceae]|uniref:Uncharacterized protein n=1 Tax=Arthrobacter bambusae TaxID=1338426 RepID=A0ABV2P9J5_9MICC
MGLLFVAGYELISTRESLILFVGGQLVYLLCLSPRPLLASVEVGFIVAE